MSFPTLLIGRNRSDFFCPPIHFGGVGCSRVRCTPNFTSREGERQFEGALRTGSYVLIDRGIGVSSFVGIQFQDGIPVGCSRSASMRSLLDFDVTFRSLPTFYAVKGSSRPTVQITMVLEATVDNEVFTDWYCDGSLFFRCTVLKTSSPSLPRRTFLDSNENIVTRLTREGHHCRP